MSPIFPKQASSFAPPLATGRGAGQSLSNAPGAAPKSAEASIYRMGERGHDTAQFRQTFQPSDRRIAGLRLSVQVIENVLPVIGSHGDGNVRSSGLLAAGFFFQDGGDYGDHVGIASPDVHLHKRSRQCRRIVA